MRCTSDCHFLPVFAEGIVGLSMSLFYVSLIGDIKLSRISKIELSENGPSKSAIIHFEKPSAAKTALMVRLSLASGHATCLAQHGLSLTEAYLMVGL